MERFSTKSVSLFTHVNKKSLLNWETGWDQNNKVHIDREFSIDDAVRALDYEKYVHPRQGGNDSIVTV
jgi:hypothetical protein